MASKRQREGSEKPAEEGPSTVDLKTLRQQNSQTTNAVIASFAESKDFSAVARKEEVGIMKRDEEDGKKLAEGIQLAVEKGILPKNVTVEPVKQVNVLGKTAAEVTDLIIEALGPAATKGCVLVLQGLSGTGKGTTVEFLKSKLPKAVTWSNGNLFRSLTLLATTAATERNCPLEDVLTPASLASFIGMLSFGKHNGVDFDVRINGLGLDVLVSDIINTDLKKPAIQTNIPTVSRLTQGEVINFVGLALKQMSDDGCSVLLEGREQTLNHIRSPHRFELVLSDTTIIGQRRAAQRIAAKANALVKDTATEAEIKAALEQSLNDLVKEQS